MPKISRESVSRPTAVHPARVPAKLKNVVGRDGEFATLLNTFESGGRAVVHLHGIPGIGKSTLLHALIGCLRDKGHAAVVVDCRTIEPTEHGLLGALRDAGVADRTRKRVRGIVALDNYANGVINNANIEKQSKLFKSSDSDSKQS
jgi:ABC-type phosphate/phosphonate transport system ATPase subunit